MILATVDEVMPLRSQYLPDIHSVSGFAPLLALQATQQSAMFSKVTIEESFMMCSQLAALPRDDGGCSNRTPQ
jgi:hypothetical protein